MRSRNSIRLAEEFKDRGAKTRLAEELEVDPSTITRLAKGQLQPGLKLRLALQKKYRYPIRGWEQEPDG